MMDMFTIIVFFLLFSYAEKPDEIEMSSDIELPVSSTQMDYDNTIKVFLSPSSVKIEEEVVASIEKDTIVGFDPKQPQISNLYKTLEKLRKQRIEEQAMKATAEGASKTADGVTEQSKAEEANKPQVLFFCDKTVPFKVINTVMKTIGMVGYPNMQFAVTGER